MSIFKLTDEHFERFDIGTNPRREYTSSSLGITGSVTLFADASTSMKEMASTFGTASGSVNDDSLEILRNQVAQTDSTNIEAGVNEYLGLVNTRESSQFLNKKQEILRSTPGVKFDKNYLRKSTIKNVLFPHYRPVYPTAQWAYSNYHTLNFVSGGNLPAESVLIYPAGTGSVTKQDWNPLAPDKRFTFDFWINPRYTTENVGDSFTAGTVLHMSSCYAISMVTGSSIGVDGKPDGYRMMLQLSHSADTNPSSVSLATANNERSYPNDLTFLSNNNSLKKNNWHHVSIRWDSAFNQGTGSFYIDNKQAGQFSIPSASVMQVTSSGATFLDPDALFVGNRYSGNNTGASAIAKFFNKSAHEEEGVTLFNDALVTDPVSFSFTNPLNAEVHDLKIYDRYKTDSQIATGSANGVGLDDPGLLFYVPPFFSKDSRNRKVLQTPFFTATGSTDDPFNVALSFGVNGKDINLENFTKDYITNQFPRLYNLTASVITTAVSDPTSANDLLYASGSTRKRNLTVIPCDNGQFFPNFDILKTTPGSNISNVASGTIGTGSFDGTYNDRFTNDFGNPDYSLITLRDLVSKDSAHSAAYATSRVPDGDENQGSLLAPATAATPEDPGISPGNVLAILQRQQDSSSNEVVFFDISNMFFGDRIKPGTFIIEDMAVSGSGGRITFKLRDDERGNLYRADSNTENAKWASVGNILYEEGIVVIKSPNMPFFGKDSFKVTFEGERSIYVLEITVPAYKSHANVSSNPSYSAMKPTENVSEISKRFTYITGLTLHDNNLNVIGRANLAQPVVKRDSDRFVFKLRMDF